MASIAARPRTNAFVATTAAGRTPRWRLRDVIILSLVLLLHGALIFLILTLPAPEQRAAIQSPLVLIDLLDPPVPPSEPPPPLNPPPAEVTGGSSSPSRTAAQPPERADTTPVVIAAPLPPPPAAATDTGTAQVSLAPQGSGSATGGTGAGGNGTGAGFGTGTGDGAGPGSGEAIAAAKWVFEPTDAELRRFNPLLPDYVRQRGGTRIACQVRLDYTVYNCRVLAEKPRYLGLGKAAIRASPMFRVYPPLKDGKPVADAWVGIVIYFSN